MKDIADFWAHREGRNIGRAYERGSKMMRLAKYAYTYPTAGIDPDVHTFAEAMRLVLSLMHPDDIFAEFRISQKKSKALLEGMLAKLSSISGAVYKFKSPPSQGEAKMLNFVLHYGALRPLFNRKALIKELIDVLRRDGLLEVQEVGKLSERSVFLALYAVYVMHGQAFNFENHTVSLSLTNFGDNIQIRALFELTEDDWIVSPVFDAECSASEWLAESLQQNELLSSADIELSLEGKLVEVAS